MCDKPLCEGMSSVNDNVCYRGVPELHSKVVEWFS